MSNFGILAMIAIVRLACNTWGAAAVVKLYGIPWLSVTHWSVSSPYLHMVVSLTHRSPVTWIVCRNYRYFGAPSLRPTPPDILPISLVG